MNVRNCRNCGKIFNYVAGAILCPSCRDAMEVKFQEVKEYIRANPGIGIREVSRECDVEQSQIQQWLREERLEVTENSPIFLSCEGCGKNIRCGKYCDKCKASLSHDLRSALRPEVTRQMPAQDSRRDNAKMRYI